MKQVFVDTSILISVISPDDLDHSASNAALNSVHAQLVTSEYVILELGSFFSRAPLRNMFDRILELLRESYELIWSNDELFERGVELFNSRPDKDWSLTDCLSFVIMEDMEISDALTLDHHFEQAGFNIIFGVDDREGPT